jgi:sugar/nucleoside kinase (ribokinase family)
MTILVVGDANADLSAALTRFPSEGDDWPITALHWGSGGSAANVAAGLARLGAPARLLVRVGVDPAAEVALRVARAAGVDLALVQCDDAVATGLCFAAISANGERTFFSFRGANIGLASPAAAPLLNVTWLHISAHALLAGAQRTTALALIEDAIRRAIPVSLDLCLPLLRDRRAEMLELLPRLQILFANEQEFAALLPDLSRTDALVQVAAARGGLIVLKRGAAGCEIAAGEQRWSQPGFVVAAIDSNGCGDAFVAGFIHAYTQGALPEDCATLANALGALTATRAGSADALPHYAELSALLSEQLDVRAAERLVALLGPSLR